MVSSAFRFRDFRYYLSARFLSICGHYMMIIAISQAVYEMTKSPLYLGMIGLALFLPKILFSLPAGHTADRYDRRGVILVCRSVHFLLTLGLMAFFLFTKSPLWLLYLLLFLIGITLTFDGPAMQSMVPHLVPQENFHNAVSWNSSIMQAALVSGPALGGWLYGASGSVLFVLSVVGIIRLAGVALTYFIRTRTGRLEEAEISWQTLMAGIHYVFKTKIILGAISLDLFAVLLGGAVALLPIYANEILKVGATGLGILRAAPSLGGAVMAILLAHRPPTKKTGLTMFFSVAVFGVMTILFGISENFLFSIFCLVLMGASDMVSVVIRGVLVQVKTPPSMRGRVSAVNMVFIGASNELGEFESGLTASWFGVVPAVVLGGVGTLAVVGLWAWRFPEMRHYVQEG